MSLQALTNLRTRHRLAPASVWVLVGDVPRGIEDDASTVIVKPGHSDFDFRPLIGLHVDVIELGDHLPLLDKVMDALELSHPKSRGLVCKAGVAGLNAEHERILEKAREYLCN